MELQLPPLRKTAYRAYSQSQTIIVKTLCDICSSRLLAGLVMVEQARTTASFARKRDARYRAARKRAKRKRLARDRDPTFSGGSFSTVEIFYHIPC